MKISARRWGWTEAAERMRPAVDEEELAFDSVVVDDGGERTLSVGAFLEMPLDQRIRLNFARKLRFFRGREPVPSDVALRSLMAAARAAS
jgi:hypothetical protein